MPTHKSIQLYIIYRGKEGRLCLDLVYFIKLLKKSCIMKCFIFNPIPIGGGLFWPPPPRFARYFHKATSSRHDVSWLFSFKYRATFETKFVTPAHTVLKPRPFEKISSTPKLLKNVNLCTKSIQTCFLQLIHIKINIFSFNGWD